MPELLLQTKLTILPLRPKLVSRSHLTKRLDRSLLPGNKLTLVSAPAGFGKSTLVSAWVRHVKQHTHVAWLSLDEGDNDLGRFLTYLVSALQTIEGDIGQGVVVALQSPRGANIEAVLTALLNEIAEFPDDMVLVLDDYHVIESRPIDQAITFLLEHLPAHMHLVISSRIDPSLPLSRLRARGQMAEIRVNDLRFSPGEVVAFLNQVMGFELAAQDIAALEARTEGWITGLQLAALSMKGLSGNDEIVTFINNFAGSNRYIQDYLTDEVLQQLDTNSKNFLLQTSILDRLNAALCDAVRFGVNESPNSSDGITVVENSDSQTMLENLDAANLFLLPLDEERCWYRYHHLFSDLLAHRLSQVFPDQIPNLHRRASVWYENEGYLDDAIRHAQAANDRERLVDIIEGHWQDIIHRGEAIRLKQLLDSIGPEYTKRSALLSMAYCWVYVLTDDIAFISQHVQDIKEVLAGRPEKDDSQRPTRLAVIPSLVETMEATISLEGKQALKAKRHAQKAISLIPAHLNPAGRMLLQGAADYRLALAHKELGEYDEACAVLLEGLEMFKASENYFGAAVTIVQIVALYEESGKTGEAIPLCEDMVDYIEEQHWQKMPPSGMVKVALAGLQADAGDITEARKNLAMGRGLLAQIESEPTIQLMKRVEGKLSKIMLQVQPLREPLSPRELGVLQMIAQGHSNREISEKLFLAMDTVKGHNRNIYGKLGVKNRTQAANKAISLKIIPPQ